MTIEQSAFEREVRELSMLIAVNEMLPADMQCQRYLARLRAKLARLQQRPKLKLVIDTCA